MDDWPSFYLLRCAADAADHDANDLGTSLVFAAVLAGMMFVAGPR